MEGREAMGSGSVAGGVTVLTSDAPSTYQISQRSDNPNSTPGSAPPPSAPLHTVAPPPQHSSFTAPLKKKRGRPRKYAPDGSVNITLSQKPMSAPVIDFSAAGKVEKIKPLSKSKTEMERFGHELVACSVGANFTPHIITVNAGEDVTMKVISFSQQGPRAICILSATGAISSVTLRQPDSSGGTLTYERMSGDHATTAIALFLNKIKSAIFGQPSYMLLCLGRFEILSLSGSFMPAETGGARSRSGGMSVSLASPDGRVVGGGVAGLLVAASPVQVVVGSFLAGNQHEQKQKKQKEPMSTIMPTAAIPISSAEPKPNPSSLFRGDNWSSFPSDNRTNATDINVSL